VPEPNERTKIVILHTNDLHSNFEQMPKIAYAFQERCQFHHDAHILKLDIGDHLDRVRMETEGTRGAANIEIINATGYDFAVLGNNEGLTFTPDWLQELYVPHATFSVIGSNIRDSNGKVPSWMQPYGITQYGEIRVGLIGVTASYNDFYSLLGWHVPDPLEIVQELVQQLRSKVDVLVVMSHLGLGKDQEMAQTISGIDCILGGHTHHLLEQPLFIGDTMICAVGKLGYHIGEIIIEFEKKANGIQQLISKTGRAIDISESADDERILQIWHSAALRSQQDLATNVGLLQHTLENDWERESVLGNLLAHSLRDWVQAEIGIVNAGQLLFPLTEGPITKQTLLECCPSPINPCKMKLRGSDLRFALEQALLSEFHQKPIFGFGFRGKVLGTLCVAGMNIDYHPDAPDYQKITSIMIGDEPFDDAREYSVATIDMFTFGIGYLSLKKGHDIRFFLPEFIRDLLADSLSNANQLEAARQKNWRII
jgi:5'-nucleotidase